MPGQQLRLEEIADRFELSTTPVREALRELESEGLVTIYPHRGAVVTELSADDLHDIYDVRATLEEMATRLAVPCITTETISQLENFIDQIDNHMGELVTLVKLNHKFHITLYSASGRRHLCELTNKLRYRTQHYLHAYITYLGGMPHAQNEHRDIVQACKDGDVELAAKTVYSHVNNVGQAIVDYVRQLSETEE